MKKVIYVLLFVTFAFFAFVLHVKNPNPVAFSLPFYDQNLPLGLLMLLSILTGVIIGATMVALSLVKSKLNTNKAKRQLIKVEREVENLRTMPLKESV